MVQTDPCRMEEYSYDSDIKLDRTQAAGPRADKVTTELKKLYIEPTSKCNLACTMCFRNTWIGEAFADMEPQVFDNIMNTMPGSVETVFFGGMGEPLHHKDILYMVQRASAKGKRTEVLTNGTLLTQKMAVSLLDAGLRMLWVSVDSFETESYEHIRQNSNFSLIKKNISKFNAERVKRDSETQLGIAFVAMKSNIGQLGRLAQFAHENSVSKVNISNVIPTDSASQKESLYDRTVSLDLNSQHTYGIYPEIDAPFMDFQYTGAREGFMDLLRSNCNILLSGQPVMRKKRYCRFIEEGNAFVRYDGDVSPCMALLHSGVTFLEGTKRTIHHHSFGNVKDQGLQDIWGSKEYSEFRDRVRTFDFSPCIQCGGCENREDNCRDCLGNQKPTCGACLWSEGIISCP
jgi:MoaA/NifB/PqqE/SkfB family radical SAM enzyme